MISNDINDLTIGQISELVGSNDIDASEFGHRVVRFLGLAAKTERNGREFTDLLNLATVLSDNLNNAAFRVHLQGALSQEVA
jgi:hypothetical protein